MPGTRNNRKEGCHLSSPIRSLLRFAHPRIEDLIHRTEPRNVFFEMHLGPMTGRIEDTKIAGVTV
jgi:hypothetical protein